MKPAPFAYHRAESTEHAVELLSGLGDAAKILGGGQSLIPMMNMRLARPQALIDISRLADLSYIRSNGEGFELGATTTHAQLERFADYPGSLDVVARAAAWIGHPAIRTRGTIGGSLAHCDPAAEWPTLMTALRASAVISGHGTSREEPMETFLGGLFTTTLADDELLIAIKILRAPDLAGFAEYARRHGDFGIAIAAVACDLTEGRVTDPHIVLGGVDFTPIRAAGAEAAMAGELPTPELFAAAGDIAATEIEPLSDSHASSGYRKQLIRSLVTEAWAASQAPDGTQKGNGP